MHCVFIECLQLCDPIFSSHMHIHCQLRAQKLMSTEISRVWFTQLTANGKNCPWFCCLYFLLLYAHTNIFTEVRMRLQTTDGKRLIRFVYDHSWLLYWLVLISVNIDFDRNVVINCMKLILQGCVFALCRHQSSVSEQSVYSSWKQQSFIGTYVQCFG